ncbi:OmpA family protein [Nocardiopsis gilva YIM 90087]|uniref:OmpA family protein n=1 Tax=Nocardiopsis gilva YIM 90087 TaxID=1235441 RepID=A0A223SBC5_9ACTN|nr:OmpA family protein [Nocardiopsis gilva]ASU85395.1 OmpA family protein [Nocardiopsis gilva YIM 90087]
MACAPLVLVTASCGLFDGADSADSKDASQERKSEVAVPEAFTREVMLFNKYGDNAAAQLELEAVEATDESTAVHLTLTNQGDTLTNLSFDNTKPILIDPVDGTAYPMMADRPLDSPARDFYGSHDDGDDVPFLKGVDNALRFYFPPLPDHVEYVTFLGFGAGVMTGVPVQRVDEHRPIPEPGVDGKKREPKPGETLDWPVREPDGDQHEFVLDAQGYVEGADSTLIREGDEETIALDADVLFAFDKAELTDEAADLLADAAASIETNGADAAGPIVITGHSDGVGDDAYNQKLSEKRAQAVREKLESLLDGGHDFDVSGKGSSEPIAEEGGKDDEEARKRNRRVELSYKVSSGRRGKEADASDDGAGIAAAERHVGLPASYRSDPGKPVAKKQDRDFDLAVYPLLRDGAHLVAEFEITNNGSGFRTPDLGDDPSLRRHTKKGGESLSGFRILQSDPELARYPLLMFYKDKYVPIAERSRAIGSGESFRLAMMFPAPSPETNEVTLDAGPFGEVSVPIT